MWEVVANFGMFVLIFQCSGNKIPHFPSSTPSFLDVNRRHSRPHLTWNILRADRVTGLSVTSLIKQIWCHHAVRSDVITAWHNRLHAQPRRDLDLSEWREMGADVRKTNGKMWTRDFIFINTKSLPESLWWCKRNQTREWLNMFMEFLDVWLLTTN